MHDDLDVEWADIDGQGLVRVYRTKSFKDGFVLLAHVGLAAEQTDYFPQATLTPSKLTVTIPPHDDGLDHRLAHAIDAAVANAVSS